MKTTDELVSLAKPLVREIEGKPRPKTRPLAGFIAELKAKLTDGAEPASPKVRQSPIPENPQ